MSESNRPVHSISIGKLSVSIWGRPGKDGSVRFYSFQFQRAYRNVDNKWEHTEAFNHEDLANLAVLADAANRWAIANPL